MAICKNCHQTVKWYHRDLLSGTCKACTAQTRNIWYAAAPWLIVLTLWVRGWMAGTSESIERLELRATKSLEESKFQQALDRKRISALEMQVKELKVDLKKNSPKTEPAADSKSEE